jgi:hypothetical protein
MLRQKTRLATKPGLPPPLPSSNGRRLPPIGDDTDPLLWKELNSGGRVSLHKGFSDFFRGPGDATVDDRLEEMGPVRWLLASREPLAFLLRVFTGLTILLLVVLTALAEMSGNWVVRAMGGLTLSWLMCAVGLTAATGISRERQKQTLIDLLMLPGPRRDLLRAKAVGALARGIWPMVVIVAILLVSMAGLRVSIASAVLLLLTAAGLGLFSTAIGIWLSARCRNALHATATWIGTMAAIVIGTFLLAEANLEPIYDGDKVQRTDYPGWTRVMNPLLAWGRLAFRYDYRADRYVWGDGSEAWPLTFADVAPALLCPLLYAVVGALLWLAAVRRFEREGRS